MKRRGAIRRQPLRDPVVCYTEPALASRKPATVFEAIVFSWGAN